MSTRNAPVQPAGRRRPAAEGLLALLVVVTLAAGTPAADAVGRACTTVLGGIAAPPSPAVQPPGRQLAAAPSDGSETSPRPRDPGCALADGPCSPRPTRVGRSSRCAHQNGRIELARCGTRSRAPPDPDA